MERKEAPGYSLRDLRNELHDLHSLARDSRGSLEAFNPTGDYTSSSRNVRQSTVRRDAQHAPPGSESRSKTSEIAETTAPVKTTQRRDAEGHQVQHKDVSAAEEHAIDWLASKEKYHLGNRDVPSRNGPSKDGGKQAETKEDPSAPLAERAAGWGLVLKKNSESGRVDGVRTRTSEEEREFRRLSEERKSLNSTTSVRTSDESGFSSDTSGASRLPRVSKDVLDALEGFQQTFVIADGTKPDLPIMYASAGFFKMTGYTSAEVVGRNCRFLQGRDTDPEEIDRVREALNEGRSYCGRILNYKKDGTAFWNLLTISPIKDDDGSVLKFIGMQVEVSQYTEGSKEDAVRPNGLSESLIKYDARQKDRASLQVTELVQAMKDPKVAIRTPNEQITFDIVHGVLKPIASKGQNDHNASRAIKSEHFQLPDLPETNNNSERVTKRTRSSGFFSLLGLDRLTGRGIQHETGEFIEPEILMTKDVDWTEISDDLDKERLKEIRRGIDLATTLERIEKNFVITDPRLPDNPIIFASDNFLELTEYSREEILGRNCRFLQGPETDRETVKQIREAIENEREVTVQLLNYTKSGRTFWNLFHLQPMRDQKGEVQYFTGVQLDGTEYFEPFTRRLSDKTAKEGSKIIRETAVSVNEAVKELPDANLKLKDLWRIHSKFVLPRPHKIHNRSWKFIRQIHHSGEKLQLKHFRPLKPLGFGDTGSVHLVELRGTGEVFAMKAMEKSMMVKRNKVHRACAEREILGMMDHPFLPTLYGSFETRTHVCLITDFCSGGELFLLLENQPKKVFREEAARFYAAEVVIALEYLHCQGVIYRDLKPENVLLQKDGHVMLSDFDLSFLASSNPQIILPPKMSRRQRKKRVVQPPVFVAEPVASCNSFVGTEEYIAPEVISGAGHTSSVDWWALGIFLYEMLYGRTPFRGKTRQKTFANILHKDLIFPRRIPTSLAARQLMNALLQRDPEGRLGSQGGTNEIKKHPFFRGINWTLIRCMRPPSLDSPMVLTKDEMDRDPDEDLEWDNFEASHPIEYF